jgi:hypothetical protein
VPLLAIAHAWAFAFVLAALLTAAVIVPALMVGLRVSASEACELVCWLTLAVVVLAQIAAVA